MSSVESSNKKNWSCGGCFVIGFFGFIVLVFVIAAIVGVRMLFRDDSKYSATVPIRVSNVSGEDQRTHTSLWLTYRYTFKNHTYRYTGQVLGSLDGMPDTACVDPHAPAKNIVLDGLGDDPGQCGDKKLDGIRHTAHLVH